MVIGAFPVAKLGVLAIKQISKPIANLLKSRAVRKFKFCIVEIDFYQNFRFVEKQRLLQDLRMHAASAVLQLV